MAVPENDKTKKDKVGRCCCQSSASCMVPACPWQSLKTIRQREDKERWRRQHNHTVAVAAVC
eukprot:scaffold98276_cov19-Tisochrysis_lutea.AAC.1